METTLVTSSPEEILQRADALFRPAQSQDLRGVIAQNLDELPRYNLHAMDRVTAILSFGRSGSLLLASYLDGHDDVLMLPQVNSARLYEFFQRYPSLSVGEKLLAYPAFAPHYYSRFFDGEFAISPTRYCAAVQAIVEFYRNEPPEFLESRRTFFLFAHIAYNLALGRPVSPHPLIVYSQHLVDDEIARFLVEDFPQAKFIHTVRDPISSSDGMFHFTFGTLSEQYPRTYSKAPYSALFYMSGQDRPHLGMESRTRTVRFEDLHSDPAGTMRELAEWLCLRYQPTLLDSTFNGILWVVTRDGKTWSGPNLEQIQRSSRNLSRKDRALLSAFFYENMADWDYPCRKVFGHAIVRSFVFASLFALPTKMEMIAARAVFKGWILPSLRQGNIWAATKSVLGIVFYRLKIIELMVPVFFRRLLFGATLLRVRRT